jgi:2-oxoglutarate dehydrogenase E2 component (dihydrolipoamide succinyltransferase)
MATIDILLPKMGESVAEATITRLVAQPGTSVQSDAPIVEIATDKVDSEVPAPEDGVLVEWLVAEGQVVQVGMPLAKFAPASLVSLAPTSSPTPTSPSTPTPTSPSTPTPTTPSTPTSPSSSRSRFYSPLVRSIAAAEGLALEELDGISGSGAEGRVTKQDLLTYLVHRTTPAQTQTQTQTQTPAQTPAQTPTPTRGEAAQPQPQPQSPPSISFSGEDEIIEMDRMRKLIADHMVRSVATSPHVTSFVEADVTRIVLWRERTKAAFERTHGTKLTFTPLFAEAIARALRDFPGVNASVDGDRIVLRKRIHLGMAAALPNGNLIVPVIRDADTLNLVGLARQVNELTERARTGKLRPDDTSGGTYTFSNVGTFGNVMGTPIINQPQVGILALGAIRKKPAVVEGPEGDTIAIRHMMFLSHSYDHRVVDGMLGGSFVRRVADYLEGFDLDRPVA